MFACILSGIHMSGMSDLANSDVIMLMHCSDSRIVIYEVEWLS